jgi:ATP-dependent helicase/nuclease subunit A
MNADRPVEWTTQQDQAITARGRNVLVTASAGTGKTAVLSARAVSLVSDAATCLDVTNMLVLTFTDAAAEQMRLRIARRLREEFDRTRDRRLMRQLTLLQGADISTIHAFCKRLITENFHALSLDPAFRVVDADESMLLKVEVLERAVEWAWHQSHLVEGLGQLLRRRNLRDASGFLGNIIRVNDFVDTVVSREQWYRRAYQLAESEDPQAGPLGQAQRQIVKDRLEAILMQFYKAKKLHEDYAPGGPWGVELQESLVRPMTDCLRQLDAGDWSGCVQIIRDFSKARAPQLRGFTEGLRELLKDLRNDAIDGFLRLRDLAILNPDYMDIAGRAANQQTRILVEVVEKFGRLYAQRKAALNGLDFADLEHYALRLLTVENTGTGQRTPSPTALALRERYKFIFVDEYQDINPVQQAILDAVSSGTNVFVVGDVKQSIYAWRGAEPTIFVERLRAAGASADNVLGVRIPLNRNFRSAPGILDFVNKIFGRIMTATLAHVDYDEDAKLHPPEAQVPVAEPGRPSPVVEMHILDESSLDGEPADEGDHDGSAAVDRIHGRQRQAGMIAQRIKELVGSESQPAMQIYDKDTLAFRNVRYGDIVILMRSLAKKANDYVEILRLAGIPVSSDATAGYFETTEINDILCLLKVLDNPQRDIDLAAVLRSPFFSFDDTELAQLRGEGILPSHQGHGQDGRATQGRDALATADFHACVTHYVDAGPDATLREKLKAALEMLAQWRTLARRGLLADLLWRIYRQTQYIAFVLALPNGQGRKANLLKLHDRAVQFEGFASSAGVPSVTRFVAFLEKLEEAGQDWAPAESAAPGNAVRILSVHKSKGLEFPIVFLAELESRFNIRDMWADVVMDAEHTLGLQVVDPRSNAKLSSLAHQVIAEKRRNTTLAEEMRILYVAMTRARDRLILTASQKGTDCGKILEKGHWLADGTIPDWLLKDSKCLLEWVLYGLADQKVLHEAFDTGLADRAGNDDLFSLTVYGGEQLRQLSQFVLGLRGRKTESPVTVGANSDSPLPEPQDIRLWSRLKDRLNWSYAFAAAVREPAKRSVTALTHQGDEFTRMDFSKALERHPAALAAPGEEAPQDARLIGTAAHLMLSTLDLTQPITYETVARTKERLVSEGAMTAAVAEQIDPAGIVAFFESELGELVHRRRNTVWREWPFTFRLPVSEAAEDFTVVQGLIDVLVRTPGGLIVIDFKTDRVSGEAVQRRAEAYRSQVELYARAAHEILKHPVLEKWLYFIRPHQAVRL